MNKYFINLWLTSPKRFNSSFGLENVNLIKTKIMLTGIELKGKLKAKIDSTDDDNVLLQLLRVLDIESKTEELYFLSEAEEIAVKEGIEQLDEGLFLSNEEANKQANQCLNR